MMPRTPVDIYEVESPYPGRLSICIRPRGGDWTVTDVHKLRARGWDVLVSALTPQEVEELQLTAVAEHCERAGVEYFHFPIGNLQTPQFDESLDRFSTLHQHLSAGRSVTAHCYGSIGRSPLIVASLLVLGGVDPDDAWLRIRKARGENVPDTLKQREWVTRFHGFTLPR